ncbi:hypothetical protein QUA20_07830 [Microcoleus sp. Pol7_A1]|uniref:hypothetical protein n=1 Tax=Microcoleus sp. Pol7_A1 TaxID=2818893 RepID=UPI002FD7760E
MSHSNIKKYARPYDKKCDRPLSLPVHPPSSAVQKRAIALNAKSAIAPFNS